VGKGPSYPWEEEEPSDDLIVPDNFGEAAIDSLNRLAADQGWPTAVVVSTACVYTHPKGRPRDHHCGDD
jgi:hypothetical protein